MAVSERRVTKVDEAAVADLQVELGHMFRDHFESSADYRANISVLRQRYRGELPPKEHDWQCNVNIPLTRYMLDAMSDDCSGTIFGAVPLYQVEAENERDDQYAATVEAALEFWNEEMRFRSKGSLAIEEQFQTGTAWIKDSVERAEPFRAASAMESGVLEVADLDARPTCEVITIENMMILPFQAPSWRRAKGAFNRVWLRWNDLENGRRAGVYSSQAVDEVGRRFERERGATELEAVQLVTPQPARSVWSAEFECWHGIYRWRVPGSDAERDYLILAMWRQDRPGDDPIALSCVEYAPIYGEDWFYSTIRAIPILNSMYGTSAAQLLEGLQLWTNATFQQATDATTLAICPPVAVAGGARRQRLRWGPMEQWNLTAPSDVQVMQVNGQMFGALTASLNMMQLVREVAERLLGPTDVTMGRPSAERRTAYEISIVTDSGSKKINQRVSHLQFGVEPGDGFEGHAIKLVNILRSFLPPKPLQLRTRRSGAGAVVVVDPRIFDGRYRFVPRGATRTSNPEIRYHRALATIEQLQQCPLTMLTPAENERSLMMKVGCLWQAYADLLQAMGHTNPEAVLGPKPKDTEAALRVLAAINPQAVPIVQQTLDIERGIQPQPTPTASPETPPLEGGETGGGGKAQPPPLSAAPGLGQGGTPGVPGPPPVPGVAPPTA